MKKYISACLSTLALNSLPVSANIDQLLREGTSDNETHNTIEWQGPYYFKDGGKAADVTIVSSYEFLTEMLRVHVNIDRQYDPSAEKEVQFSFRYDLSSEKSPIKGHNSIIIEDGEADTFRL